MSYNRKSLRNLYPPWKPGQSGNPEGRARGTYGPERRFKKMFRKAYEARELASEKAPAPKVEETESMEPRIPCTLCRHEERAVIDGLLTLGIPLRAIGQSYGFSKSSADRHKQNHLPTFPRAQEARHVIDGRTALHVPKLLLRTARFGYHADSIIRRLWDTFMDTLGDDPIDELRQVILEALSYLFRIQGRGSWDQAERDFQAALEALESWGRNRDAE